MKKLHRPKPARTAGHPEDAQVADTPLEIEPPPPEDEPSVTAEREKLIQKAMGLHREQQKVFSALTEQQRRKLSLLAHFFLFKPPPEDNADKS